VDCYHTNDEHLAFDQGVADGERGLSFEKCPFPYVEGDADAYDLREAWMCGQSLGELNRRA
jgi:hypothetical protein